MKQILRRYALLLAGVFLWAGPLQAAEAPGKVVETYEEMPAGFTADGHPYLGKADAPVVLVEYTDYQCPYCSRAQPTLQAVKERYGDSVVHVFKNLPLPIHQQAQLAGEAALCAQDQGKFWDLHDWLFANARNINIETMSAAMAEMLSRVWLPETTSMPRPPHSRNSPTRQRSLLAVIR